MNETRDEVESELVPFYYPPAPISSHQFILILPYAVLFLLGTIGNVAVLSYVFFITRSLKWSVIALGNTLLYVLVLSAVDLLVILSIPFHTSQVILNTWVFGAVICKLYWVLEWASKIHNIRQTTAIVLFTAVLSLVLVLPISISAKVSSKLDGTKYVDRAGKVFDVESSTCWDGMGREQRQWLLGLLTVIVFILPCSLLTVFYMRITFKLKGHSSAVFQSKIPIRRITIYTLFVTLFYLVCHIPFWCLQIYSLSSWKTKPSPTYLTILYVTHMFPYVAAASNWLLYAQLNSQFKKGLVLVTERWTRKQNKSQLLQQHVQTWDSVCVDLASKADDVIAICPNCEHPLTLRANVSKFIMPTIGPQA